MKKKFRIPGWSKFVGYSLPVKLILIFFFLFFVFEAIISIYPFLWAFNNSIKTAGEYYESTTALTTTWSFHNYIDVFKEFKVGNVGITTMLWNAIWQTAMYLGVNLISSMFVAYALAKFRFPGHEFLWGVLIFIQIIPIFGTGASSYKLFYELGFVNNPALIWIAWGGGFDYSAFILYGTFKGIDNAYSEAAKLDGATNAQILFKLIFPMAFPSLLALMVTNFVGRWNDYTTSQIYMNKFPNLAYGLFAYKKASQYAEASIGAYFAATIMTAIPGVILYTLFQNTILKNMVVGGIKG
jgi:ABC-type glycerol-3-phosphate transport system permease component